MTPKKSERELIKDTKFWQSLEKMHLALIDIGKEKRSRGTRKSLKKDKPTV